MTSVWSEIAAKHAATKELPKTKKVPKPKAVPKTREVPMPK